MVHFSDLDWQLPGEEAVKNYNKGDVIKVKVLDVDVTKERISLGIKQLSEDPFASAMKELKKGAIVTGTVNQVLDAGIEVKLAGDAIGFIRKTELSRERSEQRPDRFAVGEKVDAKITAIDSKTRKITLSIKQREADEEKKAMADYGSPESGASLGDILGAAISKAAEAKDTETKDEEPAAKAPISDTAKEDKGNEADAEEPAAKETAKADKPKPKEAKPKEAKPKETKAKATKAKVTKPKVTKAKAAKPKATKKKAAKAEKAETPAEADPDAASTDKSADAE